jgi:hypothetical protein
MIPNMGAIGNHCTVTSLFLTEPGNGDSDPKPQEGNGIPVEGNGQSAEIRLPQAESNEVTVPFPMSIVTLPHTP